MTESTRLERNLPGILDDLSTTPTGDYLDDLLAQTAAMRQRPAWTFPERWLPMADIASRPALAPRLPWRAIGVALIVIALIAGAAVALVGSRQPRLPAPFGPAANGLIPYASDGDVYLGDPVAGTSRLLVAGPENDGLPQTSPDGTRLAFFREVGAAGSTAAVDLWVVNVDGSGLRRITSAPIPDWQSMTWTPDGHHIALIQRVDGQNQLDVIDTAEGGSVQRFANAAGIDSISFRPTDGKEILFRALVAGKYGLFVMDADGTHVRPLIEPSVPEDVNLGLGGAGYSADGTRIFYQYADDSGCCRLWVMNADGTNQHEFVPPSAAAWDGQAVPSPDGKWIAYWHNPNDGPETHGIAIVAADGTGTVIDAGPKLRGTRHFIWSPDSSKLLMFPDNGSTDKASLIDVASGQTTTVPWGSIGDLDWQRVALPAN